MSPDFPPNSEPRFVDHTTHGIPPRLGTIGGGLVDGRFTVTGTFEAHFSSPELAQWVENLPPVPGWAVPYAAAAYALLGEHPPSRKCDCPDCRTYFEEP
jgi:hypothetical protein